MGKYSNTKFEDSLKLIRPALEWAEKQNVERLSKFLLDSANIPMYCFSSGGPSSADDYLALLYETNQGMAKSLTPLMMTSISDEALRNAKIVITAGSGTGEDEKYTIKRAAEVNPNGICGITRGNSKDNIIVKTLNGVTNNWFKYNSPKLKGFISSNSTIAMFGLFYKAFTQDSDIVSKLDLDLSPSHCFTYGARIEGAIPKINEIKNYIVLYSGWSSQFKCAIIAISVMVGLYSFPNILKILHWYCFFHQEKLTLQKGSLMGKHTEVIKTFSLRTLQ